MKKTTAMPTENPCGAMPLDWYETEQVTLRCSLPADHEGWHEFAVLPGEDDDG